MAFAEIKIGEAIVPMRASSATPYMYKSIFGQDMIKYLASKRESFKDVDSANDTVELDDSTIESGLDVIDFTNKLGFIMAMQAKNEKMHILNIANFYDWLDEFEPNTLEEASGNIIDLYFQNAQSNSSLKKNNEI